MITSKSIIDICEVYFDTKNVYGHDILIFKNPTYDDYKTLNKSLNSRKDIRVLGNSKTTQFFVWDGYSASHDDIIKDLVGTVQAPYLFRGTGVLQNFKPLIGCKLRYLYIE